MVESGRQTTAFSASSVWRPWKKRTLTNFLAKLINLARALNISQYSLDLPQRAAQCCWHQMVHVGLPVQVHEGAVAEASRGSRVSEAFVQVVTTVADIFIPLLYTPFNPHCLSIIWTNLTITNLDKSQFSNLHSIPDMQCIS